MGKVVTSIATDSSRPQSEDRVEIRISGDQVLIALADGAGGHAGGADAAEYAVQAMLGFQGQQDPAGWVSCLAEVDRQLSLNGQGGETTAVVALVTERHVYGASVGDSGAWFVRSDGIQNLTQRQQRKPLLGSGVAVPVLFQAEAGSGVLLVASDGLLKYASADRIGQGVRTTPLELASKALIDLVRLRSGALQDDVAVALCGFSARDS